MLLPEMSHWLWIWVVWERVKYGLMDKALEDAGLHMPQMGIAMGVIMLERIGYQSDSGCGQPTQCWYHVPQSWLQPTKNLLVVFEELGGDATKISLVKRSVSGVCVDVSEGHPMIKNWHIDSYGQPEEHCRPKVHLRCAPGQSISAIKFASFGTPLGTCGNFQQGACHSPDSHTILEKVNRLQLYSGGNEPK